MTRKQKKLNSPAHFNFGMKRTLPMRMMNATLGFLMRSSVASVCIKREANLKDNLVRQLCWAKGFKPWIIKCQQSSYYHNNDNKLLFLFVIIIIIITSCIFSNFSWPLTVLTYEFRILCFHFAKMYKDKW